MAFALPARKTVVAGIAGVALGCLAAVVAAEIALSAMGVAAIACIVAVVVVGFLLSENRTPERVSDPARADADAGIAGDPSGEALAAVVRALPAPALLVNDASAVRAFSQPAKALLGRDDLSGRSLPALIRHPQFLDAVHAAEGRRQMAEVTFSETIPAERHLHAAISPVSVRDWPAPGLLILLRDLSQQVKTEQMRADFIANVSHELRTPLASLTGFVETLRGPAAGDAEARDRFLRIMEEQTGRMTRLVDTLMSLSRIEGDQRSPPTGRVALNAVTSAVAESLRIVAKRRDIRIDFAGEADPDRIVGDSDQIGRAARNLIENAIKYASAGSVIELRTFNASADGPADGSPDGTAPGSHAGKAAEPAADKPGMRDNGGAFVCLSVADRGEGIPEEHLPRLTERFYRVDAARARSGLPDIGAGNAADRGAGPSQIGSGGAGLGLAIVKHIMVRHGGHLHMRSEVGVGSVFTLAIPVAPKDTDAGQKINDS